MPGLNGFDVCYMLRKDSKTKHIPIIMLTGIDKAREQVDSLQHASIYYISKGSGNQALLQTIRKVLDVSCLE